MRSVPPAVAGGSCCVDSQDRVCQYADTFQKGSSSSSCGTTLTLLSHISFRFEVTEHGYLAISVALSIGFTTATVILIFVPTKHGNVTIANTEGSSTYP